MTSDKVLEVVSKYEHALGTHKARRFEGPRFPLKTEALEHILWMCEEVRKFVTNQEMEKAMRWLGFIQGALWVSGIYTIDSMRDDNRN